MPIVSEDIPQTDGPNASMQQGQATQVGAMQHELASRTGTGSPTPAAPPAGQAPPQQQGPPPGPAQPEHQRLDMNSVFPAMPQMEEKQPWRHMVRAWAAHPDAGPALNKLSEMIQNQRGPNG